MPEVSADEWEAFLTRFEDAHILQTSAWGELKATFGWEVTRVISPSSQCGAQILFRTLLGGRRFAYIPKGPVGENWEALWPEIDVVCRKRRAICLKVEPDLWEVNCHNDGGGQASHLLLNPPTGFRLSHHSIQPLRTLVVDISGDEGAILGRMHQKTRYNVRLALKKGIVVKPTHDIGLFYRLMQVTGRRDQFEIHSQAYYQRAYELFFPRGECNLFLADYQGEPVGALMVFARGKRAWYFYGATSGSHRERMPAYLLQWEAMRWARSLGCVEYDLWGVPDADERTLESNFTLRSDGLWGVYRFKRGFGGKLLRAIGPWDRVYQSAFYALYSLWTKWVKRGGD